MSSFDVLSLDILLVLFIEYISLDAVSLINLKKAFSINTGHTAAVLNDNNTPLWRRLLWNRLNIPLTSFGLNTESVHGLVFDTAYDSAGLFARLSCLQRALKEGEWLNYSHHAKLYMDVKFDIVDGESVFRGFQPILAKVLECAYMLRYVVDAPPPNIPVIHLNRRLNIKFASSDLYSTKLTFHTGYTPNSRNSFVFLLRLERWLDISKYGPDCDLESKVEFLQYFFINISKWMKKYSNLFDIDTSERLYMGEIRFQKAVIRKILLLYTNDLQVHMLRNFCILKLMPEERGKRHIYHYRLTANPCLLHSFPIV